MKPTVLSLDMPPFLMRIVSYFQKLKLNDTQVLIVSALVVGAAAALATIAFRALINSFTLLFFQILRPALSTFLGPAAVVVLPALGGLIVGPLIYFFAREAKGLGVPEVMLAVAQKGGRIRPIVVVIKSLATAICIGSGGSAGRVGPTVLIGSTLGSAWGQLFRMSDTRMRILVACGAAAGVAATLNVPIAGVFFALEVILAEFSARTFGIVVIASVTASIIQRSAFGTLPSFPLPSYQILQITEFPFYIVLGLLGALIGVVFTYTLYWMEDRFNAITFPVYLKPALGGLLVGVIGLFLPQVFGLGYPEISTVLAGGYALGLLAPLVIAKIVAVSLTIGSGGSGGVFGPSLFIGAMLGEAYGVLSQRLFPGIIIHPGNYGLVGMAAVFAGAVRAPITAVIILFELTGNYAIILPLMIAVVISTIAAGALGKESIYTLKLKRRGIDLRTSQTHDLMGRIPVSKAMVTNILPFPATLTVAETVLQLQQGTHRAVLVVDKEDALVGVLMTDEVEMAVLNERAEETLATIIATAPATIFEDESLDEAIRCMEVLDQKLLAVVSHAHPTHAIGTLSRDDIFKAYNVALLAQQL